MSKFKCILLKGTTHKHAIKEFIQCITITNYTCPYYRALCIIILTSLEYWRSTQPVSTQDSYWREWSIYTMRKLYTGILKVICAVKVIKYGLCIMDVIHTVHMSSDGPRGSNLVVHILDWF